MNKKMKELLAKISQHRATAKSYMDGENKDVAKAKEELEAIKSLQEEYEVEKALFEAEKGGVPEATPTPSAEKKFSGFALINKMLSHKKLGEDDVGYLEKALVTDGQNGENYLMPEDVDLAIKELRKSYVSAKELATVIPTDSMSGGFNFESGTVTGLSAFDDGDDVDSSTSPSFARRSFAIKLFGKLIPISNILKLAEKANLMAYINRWFVKNAVVTENTKIFATLATGKTAVKLDDWADLKSSLNKDLDPSCLINGIIATNQDGFDVLDSSLDGLGRPILTPDPTSPSKKLLAGLPIKIYPNSQLANITINGTSCAPVFYGDTAAGVYFMEFQGGAMFAASEHALFGKNQTALRVIEGLDVLQADTSAYAYGGLVIPE